MAAKRKLNQISNYDEKFNGSSLSRSNKRNKPKYENEEDRLWRRLHNYNYDWYVLALSKHVMSDGFKCLFTIVDRFTKYGWIVPLKDKTTKYTMCIQKLHYNN